MDEYNNQNENETVNTQTEARAQSSTADGYEQKPSQKYGRTAYQQQMQEQAQQTNQQYAGVQYQQSSQQYEGNPYQQSNQQYGGNPYQQSNQQYGGNPYQQQNQQYGGPQYQQPYWQQGAAQQTHGTVKDVFCYILLALIPIGIAIDTWASALTVNAMRGWDMTNMSGMMQAIEDLANTPIYSTLSLLSNFLFIGTVIVLVLDIVNIRKENYKITGLILFAIFLRPAYWLWRAHILGRKKTVPVIYTIAMYALTIAEFVWVYIQVYGIVFQAMMSMYY